MKATNKILWVAGWACTWPQSFRNLIENNFPGFEHQWLGEADQDSFHWDLDQFSHVISWSLGSQRTLTQLSKIHGSAQKTCATSIQFIHIAPAFDFCEEEFGWDLRILTRMQKMLGRSPQSVLTDFYALVGIPQDQQTEQLAQYTQDGDSKTFSPKAIEALQLGLGELTTSLISHPNTSSVALEALKCENHLIISLSEDNLVKPELLEKLANQGIFSNLQKVNFSSHFCPQPDLIPYLKNWI